MKKIPMKTSLFSIGIILSVNIIVYSIFTTYHYNQNLEKSFMLSRPNNVYAKGEELTIDGLLNLYPSFTTAANLTPTKLKLNTTLCYYDKPKDWIPKKILLKGTEIMDCRGDSKVSDSYTLQCLYGFIFHPTYQRGWRVGIPLITEQEYNKLTEIELKLLYVRTKDIKKLEKSFIKEGVVEKDWYLAIDKRLYDEGYYLSPDLYQSYFSAPVKAVILGWIGVISWNLVRRCFKKRQKES